MKRMNINNMRMCCMRMCIAQVEESQRIDNLIHNHKKRQYYDQQNI